MRAVFDGNLNPEKLLNAIALKTNTNLDNSNVLVVFDEVQECPRALTSLKTFQQERPEIPIIAAGSLLGVALHGGRENISFPVGKVDHMFLYPMNFTEYLLAMGEDKMVGLLEQGEEPLLNSFSERFIEHLKNYYIVGGMPEAVQTFVETKSYHDVRTVQTRLLTDYELDFSKHATPSLTERIRLVWHSLPSQLARENRKFIYSAVKSGARARGYEEAIQWLVDAGLAIRVNRITKPSFPLLGYEDKEAFKLYLFDVGLLGAASRLDLSILVEGSKLFSEFKGALTENYVCQELVSTGKTTPYYWSANNSKGEVDFIYDWKGQIVPLEVKAEVNLKAKSLKTFIEHFDLQHGLRLSLAGFQHQSWITSIPLYATSLLPKHTDQFMK